MERAVFDLCIRVVRGLAAGVAALVGGAFILTLSCSSGGGGGDGGNPPPATDSVSLFTRAAVIEALTGASSVRATSLTPTSGGLFLMVDGPSGSVLLFNQRGQVAMFTSQQELQNVLGGPAALGPMDEILLGQQAGHFLAVDEVSGQLMRLEPDGTPVIHATEAQVIAFTRRTSARLKLPRFLLPGANIAQELVTGDILQIGNSGANIILFVSAVNLSVTAGVVPQQAVVAEWARGGGTRSFFARFGTTSNIVKIQENGTLSRHVEGAFLRTLFPDVSNLGVTGIVADTMSDTLLLLIADGGRGVGLAIVESLPPYTASVFTSEEEFEDELGPDYDITQIGLLAQSGIAFAVDGGGTRVMTFNNGRPIVVATEEAIGREADTTTPAISIGVDLGSFAVIVPEDTTGDMIQVQ